MIMTIGQIYSDLKSVFGILAWVTLMFVLFVVSSRYLYGMDYSTFLPVVVMLYVGVWVGLLFALVASWIYTAVSKPAVKVIK
jgi:hypothetical protein